MHLIIVIRLNYDEQFYEIYKSRTVIQKSKLITDKVMLEILDMIMYKVIYDLLYFKISYMTSGTNLLSLYTMVNVLSNLPTSVM